MSSPEDDINEKLPIDYLQLSIILTATIILAFIIGSIAFPDIIWDGFLWKYLAGPVHADATGEDVDGISEGYNPVNTLTYGLILALSVYWIYIFLDKKKIEVDVRFAFALVPYILLGSTLRVLEDADFFSGNVRYLMISPIIYLVVGLFTILTLYLGTLVERWHNLGIEGEIREVVLISFSTATLIFSYAFLIFGHFNDEFIHVGHPVLITVVTLIGAFLFRWRLWSHRILNQNNGTIDGTPNERIIVYHLFMSYLGWLILSISLYHLCWWGWHHATDPEPIVIPGIIVLTLLAWGGMLYFFRYLNGRYKWDVSTSILGMNSIMIFSQFLDGSATYTGLDFYNYREKHVLPNFFIDHTGTAAVMFVLKFMVLLFAIYLLDVEYKEDMKETPRLRGLIKIVVIVLGLAPGMRDMLRLAFGT